MSTSEIPEVTRPVSRFRRLRRWSAGMLGCHGHLLLPAAAAVLTLCSTYIIVGPVLNRSGDNIYHLMTQWAMTRGVLAGDNPLGPLGMEWGMPVLRFYQALFYLQNVGLHLLSGFDLRFWQNLTIVVCFALSPFSYTYFLRKLGLDRWTAGLGGMLSMISVAAFGNSFEAYHQAGIVTQSMGGLFFPWFMGNFIGMLRGENRATTTGALFALAFLSHAIMSVFAVFAGALYFAVARIGIRPNIKRFFVFGLIGAAMVAFWVFPFIEHTNTMRAVPDSIIRGKGVHWFTSVSTSELSMVLSSGRLLDDPPRKGDARDANDKFMDKISIIGTLSTRPPALSILTALGALIALFGLRKTSRRFLLAGLAFSLMLFAGPDDFRWLRYLPFMKQIQTFRCTYLVEFFAFGLAAIAIRSVLGAMLSFARTLRIKQVRYAVVAVWLSVALGSTGLIGVEIIRLGQTHLRVRPEKELDWMVDACRTIENRGYPYRILPKFKGRFKIRHAWLAFYGYQPYCTHWKGVGPTAGYHLCTSLGGPERNQAMFALSGVRWITGKGDPVKSLQNAHDPDGVPLWRKMPNGKDRHKGSNNSHTLLDLGQASFLRPYRAQPFPVVCTDSQWIWLTRSWTTRFRNRLWSETMPMPMRVEPGGLSRSGLLEYSKALAYLDHDRIEGDLEALEEFARGGGLILSPLPVDRVASTDPGNSPIWDALPESMKATKFEKAPSENDELDPGLEVATVEMLEPPMRTFQNYWFDVDNTEPVVALLPVENFPGWTVDIDGDKGQLFSAGPDLVGVHLPRGAHRLAFHWSMPTAHRVWLWVSIATSAWVLMVWFLAIVSRLLRRRRSP